MRAVIINANGWNANWLGCYGNEWISTPNLDRLASESVVFDQHFATNPAIKTHLSSIATGRHLFSSDVGKPPPFESLFRSLRTKGIRTVLVHDLNEPSATGSAGDWDEWVTIPALQDVSRGEALFGIVAQKLEELADVDDWLLWVETDRLLPPWTVSEDFFEEYARDIVLSEDEEEEGIPEPWCNPPAGKAELSGGEYELLHGTFASVVSEWDAELGEWFDVFRELGLEESAIWMVTSGHGLSLGEHDWIGTDNQRLYEELVHIPLLLRLPGAEEAGRRVPFLTQSIDLLPTICDLFGQTTTGVRGSSMLPLAGGSQMPLHDVLFQELPCQDRLEWALRTEEWSVLVSSDGGHPSFLFRKPEDRWEVNDARQQHMEWADYLGTILRQVAEGKCGDHEFTPKLKHYSDIAEEKCN